MLPGPTDLSSSVLAGLRAGDGGALEECYERFGARVYRLCRAMLGHHDAEDATQEVFLKVLERAEQFAGRARFTTWLHRIAVNHCLHRIEKEERRRSGVLETEELVDGTCSPLETMQAEEARTRLDELLLRLPPPQRAVLVLREIDGLAYAEIADVLGVPEGTVMSRLARARERLAALVPKSGERALPPTCSAS